MRRTILFIFLLLMADAAVSQKVDTIQLSNGNILTGEIKRLEYGNLTYKTDDMGTVEVKWEKVIRVKSPRFFEIHDDSGFRYFGSLAFSQDPHLVAILLTNAALVKNLNEITVIHPIKKAFLNRLEGNISVGYNYAKSSRNTQFNLSGGLFYRGFKRTMDLKVNSIITNTANTQTSKKQDITITYRRIITGKWFVDAYTSAEQNTELGIRLRASVFGGASRNIVQDIHNMLAASAGFALNREWTTSADTSQNNAEGLLSIKYKRFKRTSPKTDITVQGQFFPSLSSPGRIRTNADVSASLEVISDLFIGISFYHSFDNQPPTASAAKDDWGIVTSIGYSFP